MHSQALLESRAVQPSQNLDIKDNKNRSAVGGDKLFGAFFFFLSLKRRFQHLIFWCRNDLANNLLSVCSPLVNSLKSVLCSCRHLHSFCVPVNLPKLYWSVNRVNVVVSVESAVKGLKVWLWFWKLKEANTIADKVKLIVTRIHRSSGLVCM